MRMKRLSFVFVQILCMHIWPNHAAECDRIRLEIIGRMLKTPHYNCRNPANSFLYKGYSMPRKILHTQNEYAGWMT